MLAKCPPPLQILAKCPLAKCPLAKCPGFRSIQRRLTNMQPSDTLERTRLPLKVYASGRIGHGAILHFIPSNLISIK